MVAFPTAPVTPGSGLIINTLPLAGQAPMASSLPVALASDQSLIPVTSLNSGSITNPTAILTRNANAVTATVTATSASPCVFTWTGNPLLATQTVLLGGTVPTGFTALTPYYVINVAGNNFQLSLTKNGAAINSTSTGTGVTATLCYLPGAFIGPPGGAFSIATSAGGVIIPRIRLVSNITAGWGGVTLSVNLWSAIMSYAVGDGGQYAVATGGASWLANYLVTLTQFGDAAAGGGGITNANQAAIQLASGTFIRWDVTTQTQCNPIPSQTITIIPDLLN